MTDSSFGNVIFIEKNRIDGNIYDTLLLQMGKNANIKTTNSISDHYYCKFGNNQPTTKGFWCPISKSHTSISGRIA